MKTLAIIPARGGSKRIERKNIKDFCGSPIIAYSIQAALDSGCFDEVMVSTDDEEIAAVARSYGATVPFMRSAETANDFATTADVIREVLHHYQLQGKRFDAFACIYATAPFISPFRLRLGNRLITDSDAESAFTCVEYSYPIQRSLAINDMGLIHMRYPEYATARSQDLEKTYHDAGQFYFCTVKSFEECGSLWGPKTRPIVLSELEVQDLDTLTDWKLAEMKFTLLRFPGRFSTADYEFIPFQDLSYELKMEMLRGRNADDVRCHMRNSDIITKESHIAFIDKLRTRPHMAYYAVKSLDGKLLGSVNMIAQNDSTIVERGIWLFADARGKGHARRIVSQLYRHYALNTNVEKIATQVHQDNAASLALESYLGASEMEQTGEWCNFVVDTNNFKD